jgi:hypothetical protein
MDKELKTKWVAALRSGSYKQCRFVLTKDGGYCCLGVLHKLMVGIEPPQAWACDISSEEKQAVVTNWEPDHKIADGHKDDLIRMNDEGKTFGEIADYIEANI